MSEQSSIAKQIFSLSSVDSGGTVVLVSQDGIQRPPFRFPKGGHLLQFLTCLETGLLPHGQLDPPLWSQRGKVDKSSTNLPSVSSLESTTVVFVKTYTNFLIWQGKVFPKLRKRSPHSSCESFSDKDEDEATDYVFRIIYPGSQEFGTWLNQSHVVVVILCSYVVLSLLCGLSLRSICFSSILCAPSTLSCAHPSCSCRLWYCPSIRSSLASSHTSTCSLCTIDLMVR